LQAELLLHCFAFKLYQLSILLFRDAAFDLELMPAAWADRRWFKCGVTVRALPYCWRWWAAFRPRAFAILQGPIAVIVRESMFRNVTNMVQHDGVRLVFRWPQYPPDLL
jgi:hypothetical protein